jgi:hypothetical protein
MVVKSAPVLKEEIFEDNFFDIFYIFVERLEFFRSQLLIGLIDLHDDADIQPVQAEDVSDAFKELINLTRAFIYENEDTLRPYFKIKIVTRAIIKRLPYTVT